MSGWDAAARPGAAPTVEHDAAPAEFGELLQVRLAGPGEPEAQLYSPFDFEPALQAELGPSEDAVNPN